MDDIQPSLRKTVAWLRSLGFQTIDSGDGTHNVELGMEGTIEFPHVFIKVEDPASLVAECHRLLGEAEKAGFDMYQDDSSPRIECSYNPVDECAILAFYNVRDQDLPSCLDNPPPCACACEGTDSDKSVGSE